MEPIEFLYTALDIFNFLVFQILPVTVTLISLSYLYRIVVVLFKKLPSKR